MGGLARAQRRCPVHLTGGRLDRPARAACGVPPYLWSWSPDSTALAYLSDGLYIATVDGSTTKDCGHTEGSPSVHDYWRWAPDGSAVAIQLYTSADSVWTAHWYVCEVAGADDAVDMTPTGATGFAFGTGGRVAYTTDGKVIVDDVGGGNPTDVGAGLWPAASPDGSRLVYVDGTADDGGVLMTAPWDGSAQGTAVSAATAASSSYTWFSPDGSKVAFYDDWRLRIVAFDGSLDHRLSPLTTSANGDSGIQAPTWSPDGTRIAFVDQDTYSLNVAAVDTADSASAICNSGRTGGWGWLGDELLVDHGTYRDGTIQASKRGTWSASSLRSSGDTGDTGADDHDADLQTLFDRNRPEGLIIARVQRASWARRCGCTSEARTATD